VSCWGNHHLEQRATTTSPTEKLLGYARGTPKASLNSGPLER
jgi:hypothetical protein